MNSSKKSKKDERELSRSIFGTSPISKKFVDVQEEITGCSREQEQTINSRKLITAVLLIIIISIPIVIPILTYFYMVDGIVEIRVSGDFALPNSFNVYSPQVALGDFANPNNILTIDGNNSGTYKFDVVDVRVMFGHISKARTSNDILTAYLYNDDTYSDLAPYFCRGAYMGRSVSFVGTTCVNNITGNSEIVRVPRGEMPILVIITIQSQNISDYFTASFICAIGNEYDNIVDGSKLVVTIETATFNDGYFLQWLNWWDDPDLNPMPFGSPWAIGITVEKHASNPDLWNPHVR